MTDAKKSAYCVKCKARTNLDAEGRFVLHWPKDRKHAGIDGYCLGIGKEPQRTPGRLND